MHRQPFPTFEEARSMLILEEDRLGKGKKTLSTNDASSSSAKVLVATVSNSDSKSRHQQQQPARFNQNRGNIGRGNNRGRGRHNYNQNRPQFNQWNTPYWQAGYPMWPPQQFNPWTQLPNMPFPQQGLLGARPQQNHGASGNAANQKHEPTMDFASAFNTLTLMDPSDNQWYMDSGTTTHISNTTGSNDQEGNSPQ
ncbi:uncharacterized protein LOC125588281 [Brassica napus]|uniref:uncharacterized protein LOC125588281 n=1 Tax=Brassica napus TaxID=3708 RepID=UPI00207934B2|nr:uncharacterized protein LOC125588281 [Brassica napus]